MTPIETSDDLSGQQGLELLGILGGNLLVVLNVGAVADRLHRIGVRAEGLGMGDAVKNAALASARGDIGTATAEAANQSVAALAA